MCAYKNFTRARIKISSTSDFKVRIKTSPLTKKFHLFILVIKRMKMLHSKFRTQKVLLEQLLQGFEIFPFVLIPLITEYVVSSSILIVVGGNNAQNGRSDIRSCEFFNFYKNQWEYFSTLSKPQWGAFLLQVKHKLYFIGGGESKDGSGSRSCFECNLLSKDFPWKKNMCMYSPRVLPFGFFYKNEIYIFGGYMFLPIRRKTSHNG